MLTSRTPSTLGERLPLSRTKISKNSIGGIKRYLILPLIAFVTFFSSKQLSAQKNWVGGTGDWSNDAGWSPAGVPTATDDVVIDAGDSVTITSGYTVAARSIYLLGGGTVLATPGSVITINGSANDAINITDAGSSFTNAGTLTIGNTAAVNLRGIYVLNSGVFTNSAGAMLQIDNTLTFNALETNGAASTINNAGTINIGSIGTITDNGLWMAAGIFNNLPGSAVSMNNCKTAGLNINYGGIFNNGSTATLNINKTGTGINVAGSTLTNGGDINVGPVETVTANGIVINGSRFTNDSTGVVKVNKVVGQGIAVYSGSIGKNFGTLKIGSTDTVTGIGLLTSANTSMVNYASGNIEIDRTGLDGIQVYNNTPFDNFGSIKIGDLGGIGRVGLLISGSGSFRNSDSAILEINACGAGYAGIEPYNSGNCSNSGKIKIGNLRDVDFGIFAFGSFINSLTGTIDVNATSYAIEGSTSTDNKYFVNNGDIKIGNRLTSTGVVAVLLTGTSTFTNNGTITAKNLSSDIINTQATASFINNGTVTGSALGRSGLNMRPGSSIINNASGIISIDGITATAAGSGAVVFRDGGGLLTNSGELRIGINSPVSLGFTNNNNGAGTFNNTGVVNVGSTVTAGVTANQSINNNSGGKLNILAGGNFNVAGTLQNKAGATITNNSTAALAVNGTINNAGTIINNGDLQGKGTVIQSSVFTGRAGSSISPGQSLGNLRITGNFNLDTATYNCEINGKTAGTSYDVLSISGAATLTNAKLVVNWGSYTPNYGESYTILTAASLIDTFSSVAIAPVAGLIFKVTYSANSVILSVVGCTATTFTGQPASSQSYCQNAPVTALTVAATGAGLTYRWYSNSNNTNVGGTAISGATSNVYTPSSASAATTYYYALATNSCSETKASDVAAVQIVASSSSDTTASSCSPINWHNNTYSSSGVYTWTTINAAGCDSIVTLHLTIGDSIAPVITNVPVDTLLCSDLVSSQPNVTISTNCSLLSTGKFQTPGIKAVLAHKWSADSTTADAIGTATGTLYGAGYNKGILGSGGYSFDGNRSYVNVGTAGSITGTGDFAVSAWIKTALGSPQVIIQQRDNDIDGEYIFKIGSNHNNGVTNAGKLYFLVAGLGGLNEVFGNKTVSDNQWHHVSAERIANTIRIFVDGVLDTARTDAGSAAAFMNHDGNVGTYIGFDVRDQTSAFVGSIDNVEVWTGSENPYQLERIWTAEGISAKQSAAIQTITVNIPQSDMAATACGSFVWHNKTYTATGNYTWKTLSALGCDSTVTLHLTINPIASSDTTALACGMFTWHGVNYTTSGNKTFTTAAANGCDSVVTLHLTVRKSPVKATVNKHDATCYLPSNGWVEVLPTAGTAPFEYKLGTAGLYSSNNRFENLRAGSYYVYVKDAVGCISLVGPGTITQPAPFPVSADAKPTTCAAGSDGKIFVNTTGKKESAFTAPVTQFTYSIGTTGVYQISNVFDALKAATYRITVKNSEGCLSTTTATVQQPDKVTAFATAKNSTCILKPNGSITASAIGGSGTYYYKLGTAGTYASKNVFDGLKAAVTPYKVYVQDSKGCVAAPASAMIIQESNDCIAAPTFARPSFGSENSAPAFDVAIAPNPSTQMFKLSVSGNASSPVSIRVMDLNGRTVYITKGLASQSFNFGETLMPGMYMVEVRQGGEVKVLKAVKIK